jgi:hypothetical protein
MPQFNSTTFGKYTSKWLIGTAAFELLLAVGLAGTGIAVPAARGGLILTAIILAVVGVGLLWFGIRAGAKAEENARLEATGLDAQGTIVGMTQTGMFLNDNPQVRLDLSVLLPGRPAYAASVKQFVPLILLGRLTGGAVLPVKVDPANPAHVIVEWDRPAPGPVTTGWYAQPTGTGPGVGVGVAHGVAQGGETLNEIQSALQTSGLQAATPFASPDQGGYSIEMLRQHLRANGVDGWASIDAVQDSGKDVGDDHLFVITATAHVGTNPPHTSPPAVAMVPKSAASKVGPGLSVPIKADPTNPDLFMFLWERI